MPPCPAAPQDAAAITEGQCPAGLPPSTRAHPAQHALPCPESAALPPTSGPSPALSRPAPLSPASTPRSWVATALECGHVFAWTATPARPRQVGRTYILNSAFYDHPLDGVLNAMSTCVNSGQPWVRQWVFIARRHRPLCRPGRGPRRVMQEGGSCGAPTPGRQHHMTSDDKQRRADGRR
jgi:hypothetical protein